MELDKKINQARLAAWLVIGVMIAISLWALPQVGNKPVAIHWGLDWRPNGYANKYIAFFCIPVLCSFSAVICRIAMHQASRRAEPQRAKAFKNGMISYYSLLAIMFGAHLLIIYKALPR
jgi:uncharacterized membrane protein